MNRQIIDILETGCVSGDEFNESLDREQVKKLVSLFTNEVNNFSFKVKDIADEIASDRYTKNLFLEICECYIIALHLLFAHKLYDGRNEASVMLGNKLYYLGISDSGLTEGIEEDIESFRSNDLCSYFASLMTREHRTLQQSFSGIVFYMIYTYGRDSLKKEIDKAINDKELYPDFWRMPLIWVFFLERTKT